MTDLLLVGDAIEKNVQICSSRSRRVIIIGFVVCRVSRRRLQGAVGGKWSGDSDIILLFVTVRVIIRVIRLLIVGPNVGWKNSWRRPHQLFAAATIIIGIRRRSFVLTDYYYWACFSCCCCTVPYDYCLLFVFVFSRPLATLVYRCMYSCTVDWIKVLKQTKTRRKRADCCCCCSWSYCCWLSSKTIIFRMVSSVLFSSDLTSPSSLLFSLLFWWWWWRRCNRSNSKAQSVSRQTAIAKGLPIAVAGVVVIVLFADAAVAAARYAHEVPRCVSSSSSCSSSSNSSSVHFPGAGSLIHIEISLGLSSHIKKTTQSIVIFPRRWRRRPIVIALLRCCCWCCCWLYYHQNWRYHRHHHLVDSVAQVVVVLYLCEMANHCHHRLQALWIEYLL